MRDTLNAQLTSTFNNFLSQLYLNDFPFSPPFKRPDLNMGHCQNSFSILVCLQYKSGGIRSPYIQTILSRKESNWKVNAELVQNFQYVSHNIVAVMCHVPAFIKKGW